MYGIVKIIIIFIIIAIIIIIVEEDVFRALNVSSW